MTALLFHALAFLCIGARLLVSTTSHVLSIKTLQTVLPPGELIEEFVTLLARLWLWRHDRKNK
jgi:hypothetical protein